MSNFLGSFGKELLGIFEIVVGVFFINRAAYICRESPVLRAFSLLFVLMVDGAFFFIWNTTDASPFSLLIAVNPPHRIENIEIARTPVPISFRVDRVADNRLYLLDDRGRAYFATLPETLPAGATELALTPAGPVKQLVPFRPMYWIENAAGRWIVITGVDFFYLPLLLPASLLIWFGGSRGSSPPILEQLDA